MTPANNISERFRLPILQGVLPINRAQIPAEIIAGMILAALAVPEVMGYTKISGTPGRLTKVNFSNPYLDLTTAVVVEDHRRQEF